MKPRRLQHISTTTSLLRVFTTLLIFQFIAASGASRAHGSSQVTSPYIDQVLPLTPRDAEIRLVEPGSAFSHRIDELILKILKSPSGRTFCGAIGPEPLNFRRAFFINDRLVTEGYQVCEGSFAPRTIHVPFQKKYFVSETLTTDFPADGWTTPRNETFLFLNKHEISDERISRTLIHELAVSLDGKENFGFGGFVRIGNLGIQEDQNACSIVPIVRQGRIKQALSAIRAFDLERKISEELGFQLPVKFANWQGKTCPEKVLFMAAAMRDFKQSMAAETFVNSLMDQPMCLAGSSPMSSQNLSLKESAEILDNTTLTFADRTQTSACDYFTDGISFVPGLSFRGGPGPRIGGGGW